MASKLDQMFKTNEKLEQEGVEFAIDDETSFFLRHFSKSNPRVKAAMAQYYKPYAKQVELGTLDQKKADEIQVNLFVDVCLVSWKGVEEGGKPLECNKENARALFMRLPKLFETLWSHANDFNNYREDMGNS